MPPPLAPEIGEALWLQELGLAHLLDSERATGGASTGESQEVFRSASEGRWDDVARRLADRRVVEPDDHELLLGSGLAARRLGDANGALHLLVRARHVALSAGNDIAAARALAAAGIVALGAGRVDDALTALSSALGQLTESTAGSGNDEERAAILYGCGVAAQLASERTEARAAFEAAAALLREQARPLAVAACEQQLAVLARSEGDRAGAIGHALQGIAVLDARRYGLDRVDARSRWVALYSHTIALALQISVEMGDASLAAEIVESARSQGVPVPESTDGGRNETEPLPAALPVDDDGVAAPRLTPADQGILRLTAQGPIRVGGSSRLVSAHDESVTSPVDLEDIRDSVGGPGAWWWGAWASQTALHWVVLNPSGDWDAGEIALARRAPLADALERLRTATPLPLEHEPLRTTMARVAAGPLAGPPAAERELASDLAWVLPPPLQSALRRAHAAGSRITICVAPAPVMASVPLPWVAIDPALDVLDAPRVVESADVVVVPAARFMAELDERSTPTRTGPGPVGLVLDDPSSSLRWASNLVAGDTAIRLAGPEVTRHAISHALQRLRPGPGVGVFTGHARCDGPLDAHLCVARAPTDPPCLHRMQCGGTPLSSRDLLGWDPVRMPRVPNRFFLAACHTSGADRAGEAGEWWGLAPALMWAGARCVVGTSWPVVDHPVTASMDQQILDMLTSAPSAASGLAKVQLSALDRWRSTGRATSAELAGGHGHFAEDHWAPLLWAPYTLIGFARG